MWGTTFTVHLRDKMINTAALVINEDRRITVPQLIAFLDISVGSVHSTVAEHLELKRVCARWIPKLLTHISCCIQDVLQHNNVEIVIHHLYSHGSRSMRFLAFSSKLRNLYEANILHATKHVLRLWRRFWKSFQKRSFTCF